MVLRIVAPSTLLWLAHSFHFLTCGPLVVIKQLKTKRKKSNLKSKTKRKTCQSKTKRKNNKIQKPQIKKKPNSKSSQDPRGNWWGMFLPRNFPKHFPKLLPTRHISTLGPQYRDRGMEKYYCFYIDILYISYYWNYYIMLHDKSC